jgi:cobalt-zinc-cadmium efflux system membrane fusion protein
MKRINKSQFFFLVLFLVLTGSLVGYYEFRGQGLVVNSGNSKTKFPPVTEKDGNNPSEEARRNHHHENSGACNTGNTQAILLSQQVIANLGIQTAEVDIRTLAKVIEIPGIIKLPPQRITHVSPRISGRVEEILVRPGDKVEVGQKLAMLRSLEIENLHVELSEAINRLRALEESLALRKGVLQRVIRNELERNRIELVNAGNKVKLAKQSLERAKSLSDKILPAKEIQQRESEYALALGELEGVKKKLRLLGLSDKEIDRLGSTTEGRSAMDILSLSPKELLKKLTPLEGNEALNELILQEAEYRSLQVEIEGKKQRLEVLGHPPHPGHMIKDEAMIDLTSPLSGTVTSVEATLGVVAEPGKVLFQIVDPSVVYVEGDVPVENVALFKQGQEVRVRVASYPDEVFQGKVNYISDIADPVKRTIHILAEVPNPDRKLKPEIFVTLTVVVEKSVEATAVPKESILTEGVERYVFVKNGMTLVKQSVVTGISDDQYVEIKDGLFPGDVVVTKGAYELSTASINKAVPVGADGHAHTH